MVKKHNDSVAAHLYHSGLEEILACTAFFHAIVLSHSGIWASDKDQLRCDLNCVGQPSDDMRPD